MPLILTLVIQILAGAVIYILLSKLLKLESFEYLTDILKSFIKKKGKTEKNELLFIPGTIYPDIY